MPIGRRLLNNSKRKNPATVGGSTIGNVRNPSAIAFALSPARTTFRAANKPRKKEITVATIPVLKEINNGVQSRFFTISIIVSIYVSPCYHITVIKSLFSKFMDAIGIPAALL